MKKLGTNTLIKLLSLHMTGHHKKNLEMPTISLAEWIMVPKSFHVYL